MYVVSCIDDSPSAEAVCHASSWCSAVLEAPVMALHVLDKAATPALADLTGAIGLGAREHLLQELAELDHKRTKLAVKEGQLLLESAAELIDAPDVDTRQMHASLTEALDDLSDETRIVIMGRQGKDHAGKDELIGSQLETVIRLSDYPVLVVNSPFAAPQQCSIAFDGSDTATRMLNRLANSPILNNLSVTLVMASKDTARAQETLENAVRVFEGSEVKPGIQVLNDDPMQSLTRLAEDPTTLLVMGAYGHSRIREFLVGSHTNTVLKHARGPVLLIR